MKLAITTTLAIMLSTAMLPGCGAGSSGGSGNTGGSGSPSGGGGGGIVVAPPGGAEGVADLVDSVKGAVVNIDTLGANRPPIGDSGESPPPEENRRGTGSGFVLHADGLIVTNDHVVDTASAIRVTLSDGRMFQGRVVGEDPLTDLALIRIPATGLPTLRLADPASLRVGQYVVAVGSPLGLSQSVTWGILSALQRRLRYNARVDFLQTDAAINPGNSGGPLLNLKGEVIGVNTATARRGQGISFAIPVATLQQVLPQLERNGRVSHSWLGLAVGVAPDGSILIAQVAPGGPAATAGLQPGDRLLSLDGQPVSNPLAFIREVSGRPVGSTVTLGISRNGETRTVRVVLGELPAGMVRAQRASVAQI